MGNEESGQATEGQSVNGYALQWAYPGQWFDELGSMAMTMGKNSAAGIDISGRADMKRKDRDEMARAINSSGLTMYD